jgi:ketosteroid isomerase-like protein
MYLPRRQRGVTCRGMAQTDNVEVVRMLWATARKNDVDELVSLTAHDVDWRPTAVTASRLHGHGALREYLVGLRAAGRLVDAHPYSFEAVGDCVIVSGALRLRREDGGVEVIQRWWVYRVAGGKIAAAGSHDSRANALRDARAGQATGALSGVQAPADPRSPGSP